MDGIEKGRKRCTGRGERIIWAAIFFPQVFDEVAHDSGHGKGQTNLTPPHLTYPPMRKIARKHIQQPQFNLSPHGGHPPLLEGTQI